MRKTPKIGQFTPAEYVVGGNPKKASKPKPFHPVRPRGTDARKKGRYEVMTLNAEGEHNDRVR